MNEFLDETNLEKILDLKLRKDKENLTEKYEQDVEIKEHFILSSEIHLDFYFHVEQLKQNLSQNDFILDYFKTTIGYKYKNQILKWRIKCRKKE